MTNKTLNDDEVGVLVDNKIKQAQSWYGSKLSSERERVTRYYNGELPKRQGPGSSSYVSPEVYNSCESMKAQLLETFAGGPDIVRFDPTGPQDVEPARIATEYTKYNVFQQNDGYDIISAAIHDGLTARVGIAKVWWQEDCDYTEHEFSGLDEDSVRGIASQDNVHSLEATHDEDTGTYGGKFTHKVDNGKVCIKVINPEDFAVEPQTPKLSKDYFVVHRELKQQAELIEMGYPRKLIEQCNADSDLDLNSSPEMLARFQQVDSGFRSNSNDTDDDTRWLVVNEAYIKCARKGDQYPRLYKVLRCGNVTLDIEEVDDHPFIVWSPIPIPHSFYGDNFAARVIPIQNIRSVLVRAIVDHTAITVNPRFQVLKGGLTNPKELLDNRLGGIVNVTRPDAVTPIQYANLNPFVFQTLGLLQQQNEETTGISSLSQGLNKDAVSNQNSQGMVNDLVNMSQTRQKVIARNFANQFIIPLWLKVYGLIIAKENKQNIIEVAGDWQPVDPRQWGERKRASCSVHLGYGEMDREADKLASAGAMMAQDPQLGTMFQAQGRYKMASDVLNMRGIKNINDYLTPPDKIPPPQPDPMKVQELQIEQQKAQALTMQAQAADEKVKMHGAIEEMKAKLSRLQQDFKDNIAARDADRKDADIRNKIDISQREMAIAEAAPMGTETVMISPK